MSLGCVARHSPVVGSHLVVCFCPRSNSCSSGSCWAGLCRGMPPAIGAGRFRICTKQIITVQLQKPVNSIAEDAAPCGWTLPLLTGCSTDIQNAPTQPTPQATCNLPVHCVARHIVVTFTYGGDSVGVQKAISVGCPADVCLQNASILRACRTHILFRTLLSCPVREAARTGLSVAGGRRPAANDTKGLGAVGILSAATEYDAGPAMYAHLQQLCGAMRELLGVLLLAGQDAEASQCASRRWLELLSENVSAVPSSSGCRSALFCSPGKPGEGGSDGRMWPRQGPSSA